MVISNAKYNKREASLKNRAYLASLKEEELAASDANPQDLTIPRYEEMTFLSLDELIQS